MTRQPFITLVDQILAAKKQPHPSPFSKGELSNADTSALKRQIDRAGLCQAQGLSDKDLSFSDPVDGIKYEKIGNKIYEMALFEYNELEIYIDLYISQLIN